MSATACGLLMLANICCVRYATCSYCERPANCAFAKLGIVEVTACHDSLVKTSSVKSSQTKSSWDCWPPDVAVNVYGPTYTPPVTFGPGFVSVSVLDPSASAAGAAKTIKAAKINAAKFFIATAPWPLRNAVNAAHVVA